MSPHHNNKPRGFTLVELLITVTILATLAVLIIPNVRLLNRDRKIRDTARVVATVFASARQQAAVDGVAGVEIVHNSNESLANMGSTLYQLRAIPMYTGDAFDSKANITGTKSTFSLTELDEAGVENDDLIEFNYSGVWYLLHDVSATAAKIRIQAGDPTPPNGVDMPFRIRRQPIRIQSSAVQIPNGMFLNLAFSGQGIDDSSFGLPNPYPVVPPPPPPVPDPSYSTKVIFNRDGSISRLTERDDTTGQPTLVASDGNTVYLLMANSDSDQIDMSNMNGTQFLYDPDNLWILIDGRSGGVSVEKLATVPDKSETFDNQLEASRRVAKKRGSANP